MSTALALPMPIVGGRTRWEATLAFFRDPLALVERCRAAGDFVELKVFGAKQYVLNHPDLIEEVLVTKQRHFVKDGGVRQLTKIIGESLLTTDGARWLEHRRLLQPSFHRAQLATYAGSIVEATERVIASWQQYEARDVHHDSLALAADVASRTLFGSRQIEDTHRLGAALDAVLAHVSNPLNVAFPWLGRFAPRFNAARRDLDAIISRFIAERRASGEQKDDALGLLLRAFDAGTIDERALRDEALMFYVTGHETTALALSYALMLVAQHPSVERALHAEIDAVLGDRAATFEDLGRLTLADNIIDETLRLYPPVWSMARLALSDCEIGGHRVEANAQVWMAPWALHRDSRFFSAPNAFEPERWRTHTPPRFAYFPFGGGPRLCIGQSLAKLELVLGLVTIAQRYTLRFRSERFVALKPTITLRPTEPMLATPIARGARAATSLPAPVASRGCPFHRLWS